MKSIKEEISNLGDFIYKKGLSPATSGNISAKLDNSILITPSGSCLGYVEPEEVVSIDFEGKSLEPDKKPSSERFMHIEIYKKRPDINCIIHVHSPMITAFAVAHQPIDKFALAEAALILGEVPIAAYATPSSDKLAKNVAEQCQNHDIVLMANHGVVVCGNSIKTAAIKLETLQAVVETYLWATVIGKIQKLSTTDKEELAALKEKLHL